ncbi:DUF2141 domain-containing protein [Polaromonas sp.]|uniref:DUF2141 domain-containing protein n=1 Tax=Polaromonas sp. TaxID=1869339 RepID=UPI003262D553
MSPRKLAAAAMLAAAVAAHAGDLTITVENVQSDDGQVMVGLFDSAASFPKQVARGRSVGAAQRDATGKIQVVFAGLAPGTYAVSAFHDRDNSGKLNVNMIGVPSEPYGFSGKPAGRMGAPAFSDAAIQVPDTGAAISIEVK